MTNTVSFAYLSDETLLAICDYLDGDGHSIFGQGWLRELNVPEDYIDAVSRTHHSDGSPKGSISNPDGELVESLQGVYSLDLYRRMGRDLGMPGSAFGGRGFEARDWDRRIREHLEAKRGDGQHRTKGTTR
jgi:hypothetical protein